MAARRGAGKDLIGAKSGRMASHQDSEDYHAPGGFVFIISRQLMRRLYIEVEDNRPCSAY